MKKNRSKLIRLTVGSSGLPMAESVNCAEQAMVAESILTNSSAPQSNRKTFANESIYRVSTEASGILWGGAMYACTTNNFDDGPKIILTIFSILAIVGVVGGLLGKRKRLIGRGQALFSLQRSWALICSDFLWKIVSYGLIALVPAITQRLSSPNLTFMGFLNGHTGLLSAFGVHIFLMGTVVVILKSVAEDEREGEIK